MTTAGDKRNGSTSALAGFERWIGSPLLSGDALESDLAHLSAGRRVGESPRQMRAAQSQDDLDTDPRIR
jgi:hypothetical protein